LKILICLHDYLPYHKGGSEIHAHQTGAELARRGHDVTALFTERDLSADEGSVRRGLLDGVKTIEVVHQREYADVRETWEERPSLEILSSLLDVQRPDVVHFHHLASWGSGAVGAAHEAGARVLVTLHDYHLICDAATLLRPDGELCEEGLQGRCTECIRRHPLLPERFGPGAEGMDEDALYAQAVRERFEKHRQDLRLADRVLSPSHFLADVFSRAGFFAKEDCEVLKAGYPGPLHPARSHVRKGAFRVGYVGGIYPPKGVHVLVRAFQHLADVHAELHVFGHLDWFPDYVEKLERDAGEGPIFFHGHFEPTEIDEVLGDLDCLVVPSVWYENMPITVHEAYRNGLPVIATDLGGMRECVQDGVSGLLFTRGDEEALARAIRRLVSEPGLYARLSHGRLVVPTLGQVVDRLEELYRG